jgi:DNA invertase Pin-like site-specific DNA recombinase
MAVYGVTRVSTLDQVEGTSLVEQERKIDAVAALADLEVDQIFSDPGISGGVHLSDRPAGGELISLLATGDIVIAAKLDRLFRSAADALTTIEDWKAREIDLIIAEFGPTPVTENGISKMMVGLLAVVADFERSLIRERMATGRAAKKQMGGHIGGYCPFGYRKVGAGKGAMLVAVDDEQRAIDRMEALREENLSLRVIAERINDECGFTVSHVAVKNALARREELRQ